MAAWSYAYRRPVLQGKSPCTWQIYEGIASFSFIAACGALCETGTLAAPIKTPSSCHNIVTLLQTHSSAAGLAPLQPPFAGLTLPTAVLSPTLGQQVRSNEFKLWASDVSISWTYTHLSALLGANELGQRIGSSVWMAWQLVLTCSSTPSFYRTTVSWAQIQFTFSSLVWCFSHPPPLKFHLLELCDFTKSAETHVCTQLSPTKSFTKPTFLVISKADFEGRMKGTKLYHGEIGSE